MQFVQVLSIDNSGPKQAFFLKLLSSYECYGLDPRTYFNFCRNNVIYYFRSTESFQVPHQALLISQPKLYLNLIKSSKEVHLAMIKYIGNKLFKPSINSPVLVELTGLINAITTCTLDRSVPVIKSFTECIQDLHNSTYHLDSSSSEYHPYPSDHLSILTALTESLKKDLSSRQLKLFEQAVDQLRVVTSKYIQE